MLRLATLGPPRLTLDDAPLLLFDKVQALLLYLAIEAQTTHRRDTLAALLWPEQPDKAARNNLRVTLFRLRAALNEADAAQPYLLVTNSTVAFNPQAAYDLDLARFDQLLAHDQLAEAVTLYRGDFLHGFYLADSIAFEAWAQILRQRFHTRALETLARLADRHLAQAAYSAAHRYALRQLELEPWREEAHRQLMRGLALAGQRDAALAQYETCRRALLANLNIEPSEETSRLWSRIRAGELSPSVEPQSPTSSTPTPAVDVLSPTALPVPFIGREPERARIAEQLAEPACRLLTLLGPAGIGKTRLAQQIATELAAHFADGAHLVPLAALTAPNFLPTAILQTLNRPGDASLTDYLADKELLLILDHLQHLIGPHERRVTHFITDLLRQAPRLKIIVTTRTRLHLAHERLLKISGLPTPPLARRRTAETLTDLDSYSAVRLFLEHATRARPGFTLTPVSQAAIARLTQLIEGVPLALELAATWVSEFTPETITQDIETQLAAPLAQFNYAQPRPLTAVFESTWGRLTETERRAYRQLSVCLSEFSASAAAIIAQCDPLTLTTLASKNLLRVINSERYELPSALFSLAADKLTQAPEEIEPARERHCAYYLSLIASASSPLTFDLPNFREAWRRAAESGNLPALAQALDPLCDFYDAQHLYTEGEAIAWHATAGLGDAPDPETEVAPELNQLLGRAAVRQGLFNWRLDHLDAARELLTQGAQRLRLAAVQPQLAHALDHLGALAAVQGDYESATQHFHESLALYRALGNTEAEAQTLSTLANLAYTQEDYATARQLGRQAVGLYRARGDSAALSVALDSLGTTALALEDYSEAESLLSEALAICHSQTDKKGMASALSQLGAVACGRGRYPEAQRLLDESLALSRALPSPWLTAHTLCYLHETAFALEDYSTAQAHLHAALQEVQTARAARLTLTLLFCAARFLIHQNQPEPAGELLALVVSSPIAAQQTRARATRLISELAPESQLDTPTISLPEALAWLTSHLSPPTSNL